MKILYDHQIFTQQIYGGISRYFFELANHIVLNKPEKVTVKIVSPFYKNNYLSADNTNFLFRGFKLPDFTKSAGLCSIMNSFFFPILSKHYNPNIIHQTYYDILKYKRIRAKKIITIHDMIHELFPDEFLKKDNTSKLKKIAVANADHRICVSKNTQNDLIKLFNVDIKKTTVIHHGFSLRTQEIKNPEKTHKPFLLYIGSRKGYKNFKRFIEAYAANKIKNFFDLVIFGGGKINKDEIAIFDRLEIPRHSIKQVDGDDALLGGYYKNASLFIYPSLYEGFGIPPLEAMSYGCPVVCSNISSIPEVVGDGALLFDPYSVSSIKDNIISVLYDDKIRSSLILKGLKHVKKFSWERCAKETYKVYKEVLR